MSLLRFEDMSVHYGAHKIVHHANLSVARGQCVAIVGESGSGKSQLWMSALGLTDAQVSGRVYFEEQAVESAQLLLGKRIGCIFQQPETALTPHLTIASQLAETAGTRDAGVLVQALAEVGIARPAERLHHYPHQLSGGERQRVMIAMALAHHPDVLIADEPTTALDVLVARDIMDMIAHLRQARGMALVLISHDLAQVAGRADHVVVMEKGVIVEQGPARQLLRQPQAPYTRRLRAAAPSFADPPAPPCAHQEIVMRAQDLRVAFAQRSPWGRKKWVEAVAGVDLHLHKGEALGIVGASGSGKSTLARAIARLGPCTGGQLLWQDQPVPARSAMTTAWRRTMQMVYQDPRDSLDPMLCVQDAIAAPLRSLCPDVDKADYPQRVADMMQAVALPASLARAKPRSLSGGQAQRVAIARALISDPQLLICDEATSALDVSVQAEILALIAQLAQARGLALIFVSHDLAVVRRLCQRVLVMQAGKIVEEGPTAEVIAAPRHAFTQALVAAVPHFED